MDPNQSGTRRYFYEYVFYNAVDSLRAQGYAIRRSEAEELREGVAEVLEEKGYNDWDTLKVSQFLTSVNEAVAERYEEEQLFDPADGSNTLFVSAKTQFSRMIRDNDLPTRFPISPYDPRFAGRENVMRLGNELGYLDVNAIEQDRLKVKDLDKPHGLKIHSLRGERLNEIGLVRSWSDFLGISRLMPYVSAEEADTMREWMKLGVCNDEGKVVKPKVPTKEGLDNAEAILRHLSDTGVEYEVRRDRQVGQMMVYVPATKTEIRLLDLKGNQHYIGRSYSNGVTTRFSTDARDSANVKQSRTFMPKPDQVVDLVRYSLGENIQSQDGYGMVGTVGEYKNAWGKSMNRSFLTSGSRVSVYGDHPDGGGGKITIRRDVSRHNNGTYFVPGLEASHERSTEFLNDAILSARTRVIEEVDVDHLIASVGSEEGPEYSVDPRLAQIQREYFAFLSGEEDAVLLYPGASKDAYEALVGATDDAGFLGDREISAELQERDERFAELKPEEAVREHVKALADEMVGRYELHEVIDGDLVKRERRFDPNVVARYMTSSAGYFTNLDSLASAVRANKDVQPDELIGEGYEADRFRNQLMEFNPETAYEMNGPKASEFIKRMEGVVYESLASEGLSDIQMMIDDRGIVEFSGTRAMRQAADGKRAEVRGTLGQILDPNDDGSVYTKSEYGQNYMFVPGYTATIAAQRPGEDLSLEERTILKGYEQHVSETVRHQIRMMLSQGRTVVGGPTCINGVYSRLHDVRHDLDYMEKSNEEGLDEDWRKAILATEAKRVRYSNLIKEGSGFATAHAASRGEVDAEDDTFRTPFSLTGGRNMSVMDERSDGYFDPIMTSGGMNQGITRYLVESATVMHDGYIAKGDEDDRTPLFKHESMKSVEYDPFDRQQMAASNLMQASSITEKTKVSMMSFGGWNFDDGFVISKAYAEKAQVRGTDGEMRPLMVGDKLSELHSNKGVVCLVVDPDMDMELAEEQDLGEAVKIFRDNPELEVVASPFSFTRFNAGSFREAQANDVHDLHVNGEVIPGGIFEEDFIVTHMTIDAKTKVYDEETFAQGKGRNASGQLAWALNSHGAEGVMREFYGSNNGSLAKVREYLVAMGLDMHADGTLSMDRVHQTAEDVRQRFELGEVPVTEKGVLHGKEVEKRFRSLIEGAGGDLALPFSMRYPDPGGAKGRFMPTDENGMTLMPVLSASVRSGQELDDGSVTSHDYTNHYLTIFKRAMEYKHAEEALAAHEAGEAELTENMRERYEKTMKDAPEAAQRAYYLITSDIEKRRLSGKHNMVKSEIMTNPLPESATAVWTADPRLDVDTVAMGPQMAASLGVKDGRYVSIWRDPILCDGGVRYMRVNVDERVKSIAINPVADMSFAGDFDGDAAGVKRMLTGFGHRSAMETMRVQKNMLNLGVPQDENGDYPLYFQDGLDLAVTKAKDPRFAEEFEAIGKQANELHRKIEAGELSGAERESAEARVLDRYSNYVRGAFMQQYGTSVIRFDSPEAHIQSIREACIETGAKGKESQLEDYCKHMGYDLKNGVDLGHTLATRKDHQNTMTATAVKAMTGVPGAVSQRTMRALSEICPESALAVTEPITQSALQSKHNAEEAIRKSDNIMGGMSPIRHVFKGRIVERKPSGEWDAKYGEDGRPVHATKDEWVKATMAFYEAKDGLNVKVNKKHFENVAEAISDNRGYMINPEDPKHLMGSTMNRLAYGGDFSSYIEATHKGEGFFDKPFARQFAPSKVQRFFDAEELPVIAKQDVHHRVEKKTSRYVKSAPKKAPVSSNLDQEIEL